MSEQYVVVTTVQTFRHRYVVPISELQKMNENCQVDPKWALDAVVMEEVQEFSQHHLGEQVADMFVMDEDEIVDLFDKDNDYASSWTREYKLAFIQNWKENPSPEEREALEKIRQSHFRQERYHEAIGRMYREEDDIYSSGMTLPSDREYEI